MLPAETVVLGKPLPAEIGRVFTLPAETRERNQNHTNSLCRKRKLADSFIPCVYCDLRRRSQRQALSFSVIHTEDRIHACHVCSKEF